VNVEVIIGIPKADQRAVLRLNSAGAGYICWYRVA
jgi:hypothetical protein